jgi:hypothetical protein
VSVTLSNFVQLASGQASESPVAKESSTVARFAQDDSAVISRNAALTTAKAASVIAAETEEASVALR